MLNQAYQHPNEPTRLQCPLRAGSHLALQSVPTPVSRLAFTFPRLPKLEDYQMRASKENAAASSKELKYLNKVLCQTRMEPTRSSRIATGIQHIQSFLDAAQRKLPSDAAYERERKRRRA